MFEGLRTRYSRWQRYSRTVSELEGLSNRDLADLGINRVDIQRLAREGMKFTSELLPPMVNPRFNCACFRYKGYTRTPPRYATDRGKSASGTMVDEIAPVN